MQEITRLISQALGISLRQTEQTLNLLTIAPAKILNGYAKDHENFVLKAGFVEGELLDAAGVKELADTPSKEVLIGRLMGSLQSGLYGFAYAIQAIIDKAEGGESAEAAE